MSRSKHTDPRPVRAARRLRAPHQERGAGDLSARRQGQAVQTACTLPIRLRIIIERPRPGFHHPAGRRDILDFLEIAVPSAQYGLQSIELRRAPAGQSATVFGRYHAPGRIVLFEQPLPPWRLPGSLKPAASQRLQEAGALVTPLIEAAATLVDWPDDSLRRFMLHEVLLHEIGHHILQHETGKRPVRIARTPDHEAFAANYVRKRGRTEP